MYSLGQIFLLLVVKRQSWSKKINKVILHLMNEI